MAAPEGWFEEREVVGKPIRVQDRELIPIAKVRSFRKQRLNLRQQQVDGGGIGWFHIRPVAIVERRGETERVIPIRHPTAQALRWMLIGALILPVLSSLLIALFGRRKGGY